MGITDYRLGFDPGVPGTVASGLKSYDVRTKYNASGGVIGFGRAVVKATGSDDSVTVPATGLTDFVGIALRSYVYEDTETADGAAGYPPKKQLDVLTSGEIWVETEEAVAPGEGVFFRAIATGAEVAGKFRNDADAGDCIAITGARWITSTTGAGVARLQINLP